MDITPPPADAADKNAGQNTPESTATASEPEVILRTVQGDALLLDNGRPPTRKHAMVPKFETSLLSVEDLEPKGSNKLDFRGASSKNNGVSPMINSMIRILDKSQDDAKSTSLLSLSMSEHTLSHSRGPSPHIIQKKENPRNQRESLVEQHETLFASAEPPGVICSASERS